VPTFPSSPDHIIVPLTSRLTNLAPGEFALADWSGAGLNVTTAVKRGIYTVHASLIVKTVGQLSTSDVAALSQTLRLCLQLS